MSNRETALHAAIRSFAGDISPIKILLEHDDNDINVCDLNGETPLHLAVRNEHCPRRLVELLIEHGADVNVVNFNHDTPLHLAVAAVQDFTDYGVRFAVLLERGANVNAVNINGDTPLHLAAQNESDSSSGVHFLLEPQHGTDVNIGNLNGDTPLHFYLQNKASKFFYDIRTFLKNVRDINAANSKGETPLHFAVRNEACCKVEYIKVLLEFGADVSRKDAQGENAYEAYCHALVEYNRKADPMLQILLQSNEQQHMNSSLHVACLFHNVDAVHKLLRFGADLNSTENFCFPPMFYALVAAEDHDKDKASTVRLMLDYGADFNYQFPREDSPLRDINMFSWTSIIFEPSVNNWHIPKIFFEHLAKLSTLREVQLERGIANVEEVLNERYRRCINYQLRILMGDDLTEYNEWLFRCSEELKAMMKIKIGESKVSVLDLLLASARETAIYAKNKELVKAFKENQSKFPMYQGMLDAKLAKEIERRELIESAAVVLSNALKFADPSDEFFERTLSYCSNEDLIHVIAME